MDTFILDVDGVLTTGHFYYSKEGKLLKVFGPDDNDALSLLKPFLEIIFVTGDKRGFEISKKRIDDDMGFPIHLVSTTKRINWIITDINDFNPKIKYSFWHDRALFHFLTEKKQIKRYTEIVNSFARNFLVGTFSKLGPSKCSGLDIRQYDKNSLEKLFCFGNLIMKECEYINHVTPFKTIQNFIFCSFSSKSTIEQ